MQLDKFYNPTKGYDNSDMILVTPRSFNCNVPLPGILAKFFYKLKVFNIFYIVQRNSATINDGSHITNVGSTKYKGDALKVKEQLFNSHMERNVFDSLHSYSKFSSLGGTNTMEKKRRKYKSNQSLKKKRGKNMSYKKTVKDDLTPGPFRDQLVMKNYRSANFTSAAGKMVPKQSDSSKKRYQYHKRIRSDTGNTLISPLEQIYDKTKVMPRDEGQLKYTNPSKAGGSNTIQLSKYEFAPSFSHHKHVSMESNAQYRKFKVNKNPSNAHKIDNTKTKKLVMPKTGVKKGSLEGRSHSQGKHEGNTSLFVIVTIICLI